jgi:hypothetical protein
MDTFAWFQFNKYAESIKANNKWDEQLPIVPNQQEPYSEPLWDTEEQNPTTDIQSLLQGIWM